jgi:uncharacterized protein
MVASMSLQQKITQDMRDSIGKDKSRLGILRFIVGEFTHIPNEELAKYPNKELPDDKVVSIIRKCIATEKSLDDPNSSVIEILESYLPQSAPDDEILAWIMKNIDFTQFKNRIQAMKPIMAEFAGRTDGNTVKKILEGIT